MVKGRRRGKDEAERSAIGRRKVRAAVFVVLCEEMIYGGVNMSKRKCGMIYGG